MSRELPEVIESHWIKECKGPEKRIPLGKSPGKDVTVFVLDGGDKTSFQVNCQNFNSPNNECKVSQTKATCIFVNDDSETQSTPVEKPLEGRKAIFPHFIQESPRFLG